MDFKVFRKFIQSTSCLCGRCLPLELSPPKLNVHQLTVEIFDHNRELYREQNTDFILYKAPNDTIIAIGKLQVVDETNTIILLSHLEKTIAHNMGITVIGDFQPITKISDMEVVPFDNDQYRELSQNFIIYEISKDKIGVTGKFSQNERKPLSDLDRWIAEKAGFIVDGGGCATKPARKK